MAPTEILSSPLALEILLVGGIGAVFRYGVLAVCAHIAGPFPLGILTVNAIAAFAGAAAWAAKPSEALLILIGGGLVGSIGTLSSLASELIALFLRRRYWTLVAFILLTLVTGLLATALGIEWGEGFAESISAGGI